MFNYIWKLRGRFDLCDSYGIILLTWYQTYSIISIISFNFRVISCISIVIADQ